MANGIVIKPQLKENNNINSKNINSFTTWWCLILDLSTRSCVYIFVLQI